MKRWAMVIFGWILAATSLCFPIVIQAATAGAREAWTTGRIVGSPNPPAPYDVRRIFPSITFEHPVDLTFAPDGRHLLVAEQAGRFLAVDIANPNAKPELVVDLRRHHRPFDGVLGFTLHPGFATNHFVFINYNEPGGREDGSFVSRFTLATNDSAWRIDPATEVVILRWLSGGHNGCTLAFGNDGFLYISTGDASDPDPPDSKRKTGQDISDLLASVLRIDVDHPAPGRTYSIPTDNPFIKLPRARPEVWAFGFRNPFRMSFDRPTGDLWVGDVGWEQWEMVYRVQRGGNYGWSLTEGPNSEVRRDVETGPGPILPPLFSVPHSEGASITGGQVYHGRRLPNLSGAYIYGDWETGKFWALRQANGKLVSNEELCDTVLKPTAFALDAQGELVVIDYNGGLYEFVPNNAAPANQSFPRRLSDTGLFVSTQPLRPAPGTIPYRIAAPMWNDFATAEWLLAIPGREMVETAGGVGNITGGTWKFPTNTVLARTLRLPMQLGHDDSVRPIETQILHWDGQAWNPYSYRWRKNADDADLVGNSGTNENFVVRDPSATGGQRTIPWRFMARAECLRCHNAWAGDALTLNWPQLGSPDAEESELRRLVASNAIRLKDAPSHAETLAYPYDETATIEERARSWLHVNCATCHRFGAGGGVVIHLNFEKPQAEMRVFDTPPLRGDFGLVGARIVAPGDPYRSALYYRMSTEGTGRMPHIGSRVTDPEGQSLLADWIRSLPSRGGDDRGATNTTAVATLRADIQRQVMALKGNGRSAAMLALFQTMNGSLALFDQAKEQPSLREAATQTANTHSNLLVRDLFQSLLPPEARRATLDSAIQPQRILSLRGDAKRGRELFHGSAQCNRCHQVEGQGRAFGPGLTGLQAKYSRAQLLDQILNPSATIAPEYRVFSVTMRDDRELSGFLVRRTAETLVIRDGELQEHSLPVAETGDIRQSGLSAMPEGLLSSLTAQEAADLLDYIFGLPANPAGTAPAAQR